MISKALIIICCFTALIHMTEALSYCMRLAGVRTKNIAIALSFVSSTLLVSRLSNMFQAPLLGAMLDTAILDGSSTALIALEQSFRLVIVAAFIGAFIGALLTPATVIVFQKAIIKFQQCGSLPRVFIAACKPRHIWTFFTLIKVPRLAQLKSLSLKGVPRSFLIINVGVTSIYTIGVLCALLAGAYVPTFRSTALQLSGIVNGVATIMLTILVDPPGGRITDMVANGHLQEKQLRSVVFFLQLGRIVGILILSQLLLKPFTLYIITITKWLSNYVT